MLMICVAITKSCIFSTANVEGNYIYILYALNRERRKRCKQRHDNGLKKKKSAGDNMGDSSVNKGSPFLYTAIAYTAVAWMI